MGLKNLINKILNVEVPPAIEKLILKNQSPVTKKEVKPNIGITLNAGAQQAEKKKFQEIAISTITEASASGYFKPEKMHLVSEKIMKISQPYIAYSDPFNYNDCLSLEEKKNLGLNTRQKFSREFIETLSEKGLSHPNPKDILKIIYLKHFHSIHRKYELLHLKSIGLKTVKISDCRDERDCKAIKRLKKTWLIDKVPELPLPGCTAEYCRCSYIMDEKTMFD
jgi:hypothetical protein